MTTPSPKQSAQNIVERVKELQELHRDYNFKDSSKHLGKNSDSICLRDGDFRIDFSDNNMSVYKDCKFGQCDTECSCWDDVAATLKGASEFVEGCYKHFPALADAFLANEERMAKMQKQLPEGMENCTIVFEECKKGHGNLRGTNWVKHECGQCKIDGLGLKLRIAVEALEDIANDDCHCTLVNQTAKEALSKISSLPACMIKSGKRKGQEEDSWGGLVKAGERLCTSCFRKRGGVPFF